MRRVPMGVPLSKDVFALSRGEATKRAAGATPSGGGVVAELLKVFIGGGVHPRNALLRCFSGLEFREQGN